MSATFEFDVVQIIIRAFFLVVRDDVIVMSPPTCRRLRHSKPSLSLVCQVSGGKVPPATEADR